MPPNPTRSPLPHNRKPRFPRTQHPSFKGGRRPDDESEVRIFGLHAAEAALKNPVRKVRSAMATENAAAKLADAFRQRGMEPETTTPRQLDKELGPDTVHQGVFLVAEPLPEPSIEDMIACGLAGKPLIVLDQVTDPHNVGAILRSGAVFGCGGLIMTRRNSPPLGGVLAKSASGGLEYVPVHLATNLARAIAALNDAGFATVGLEGTAAHALHESLKHDTPLALVLGAEGKGLRQLTSETCTMLCRIETAGALASLNVSNAAAIALHLASLRS